MRDIEDISLEELEAIADDESVKVPEELESELKSSMDMLSLLDRRRHRRMARIAGLAASLVLITSAGLGIADWMDRPKDTFTDPYEAYAQLDQAFSLISDKFGQGAQIASGAEQVMDKTNQIIDRIK